MAEQRTIPIDSIIGGIAPSEFFSNEQSAEYLNAVGIDPDMPKDDSSKKLSGLLRPTAMAKFSGTEITGVPFWIIPNPKNTDTYVYANDGKVHLVTSALAMGTALNGGSALTSASGNGGDYYDNAAYFAKNTDIARYHPLDGSPALTQTYWTVTLGKTALTNPTYPSINGVAIPNHYMKRHTNDSLYVCDVQSSKGVLHRIITTKTTVEGDTNNNSQASVLDLDHGYYPVAIELVGTDLYVAAFEGTNTSIKQKPASLFVWDTTSDSFQKIVQVEFPDPLITAIKNVNGVLFVFSGSALGGCRISVHSGGYNFQEIEYLPECLPPLQSAVDAFLNKILWGSQTTEPSTYGCVWSYGSMKKKLAFGIHNILKQSSEGSTPMVTAVKYFEQHANFGQYPIIGWTDGSGKGLDKRTTTYTNSFFTSKKYKVGRPFEVTKITIPFVQAIAANMTLAVKIIFDDGTATTVATITNTAPYSGKKFAKLVKAGLTGQHNFSLRLEWTGTALLTVALPILVDINIKDT